MRRLRFYLDTSVLGAIFDIEDPERVEATRRLIEKIRKKEYRGYLSNLSINEALKSPEDIKDELVDIIKETGFAFLEETSESAELAEAYLKEGIFPLKYRDDARHVAVAVVSDMDAIISWNYRHMVNFESKLKINSVNLKNGYKTIDIVTPLGVVGYGEMEI